eukprot:11181607-Lingulodinium_polyedra.AAC.1
MSATSSSGSRRSWLQTCRRCGQCRSCSQEGPGKETGAEASASWQFPRVGLDEQEWPPFLDCAGRCGQGSQAA